MSNLIKIETIPKKIKTDLNTNLKIEDKRFHEEAKFAIDIWNNQKNTYLRKSTKASFYNAIYNIHTIGLSLNPVKKEAYLIPRKNGDNIEICLEPSYMGLIKLLTDAGVIKNIQTNVVYEGCKFEQFYDINGANFNHIPYYVSNTDKGNIIGVYSIAFLTNGNTQFEYMDYDEINRIKETSESYKSYIKRKKEGKYATAVWVDYESEMTRKTILRRIYKYLPKSTGTQSDFIDNAIRLDESAFDASLDQITFIEGLLTTSDLDEDEKQAIERDIVTMTSADAKRCIDNLYNRQLPKDEVYSLQRSETEVAEIAKQKEIFDK